MKKKIPLLGALSVYEILRLCVILTVQAEYSQSRLPLAWYMSVPLLMLPFFLLYTLYKNSLYTPFVLQLYGIIKIAAVGGFIFFIYRGFIREAADVPLTLNRTDLIKTLIYVMPFFTIDVILSMLFMLKTYKAQDKTEGEPCK